MTGPDVPALIAGGTIAFVIIGLFVLIYAMHRK